MAAPSTDPGASEPAGLLVLESGHEQLRETAYLIETVR